MPSVCFTGRGYNARGRFVERSTWTQLARDADWSVHDSVFPGLTYLVASTSHTTKAQAADRLGVEVISYNEFHDRVRGSIPVPEYSIGFFRGQFTAMYGETCLSREPSSTRAVSVIRMHARGRRQTSPRIVWTQEAERQRNRMTSSSLAADMNRLAGYASPPAGYASPPPPPAAPPKPTATPLTEPRRAINWED